MLRFLIYGWTGRWLPHGKATSNEALSGLWFSPPWSLSDMLTELIDGFTVEAD